MSRQGADIDVANEREKEKYFRRSHKYLGGNILGLSSCERSSRQSSGQSI